jgi:hypothetical protein
MPAVSSIDVVCTVAISYWLRVLRTISNPLDSGAERPRQHEFRFEDRPGGLDSAVQGGRHPAQGRMADLPLNANRKTFRAILLSSLVGTLPPGPSRYSSINSFRGIHRYCHSARRSEKSSSSL